MNLNLNGQWPIPCSRLVVGLGTGRRHASTAGGPHAACPRRALALAAPPVRLTIRIASENA